MDPMGGIVMTNDGNAILREIQVQHPAAKSMIEISRTQDEETVCSLVGCMCRSTSKSWSRSIFAFVPTKHHASYQSFPNPCYECRNDGLSI